MQSIKVKDEPKLESHSRKNEIHSIPNKQAEEKVNQFTFEEMRLKVGDQLQVKLPLQAKGTCHSVNSGYYLANLIGYYQDRSLLTSIPQSTHLAGSSLVENEELDIYFFDGKILFKFSAFVDKIISFPFKYMHLSFPVHISGKTIRKSKRINVCIDAIVKNVQSSVIISDISTTGAKIESISDIGGSGDLIEIAFTANKEKSINVRAMIRSFTITRSNERPFCYGIEFIKLNPEQTEELRNLVYLSVIDCFTK